MCLDRIVEVCTLEYEQVRVITGRITPISVRVFVTRQYSTEKMSINSI